MTKNKHKQKEKPYTLQRVRLWENNNVILLFLGKRYYITNDLKCQGFLQIFLPQGGVDQAIALFVVFLIKYTERGERTCFIIIMSTS